MYHSKRRIHCLMAFFCIIALFFAASCSSKQNSTTSFTQTTYSESNQSSGSQSAYEYTSTNGTVFSTTLGFADISINNTKVQPATAKFVSNKAGGETVRIEDYDKGCDLAVAAPLNYYTANEVYSRTTINNLNPGSFSIHADQGPINIIGFIEEDYIVDGSITVVQYNKSDVCQFFLTAQYYEDSAKTQLVQLEAFAAVSYQDSSGSGTTNTPSQSSNSQYSLPISSQCTVCHGTKVCPTCNGQKHSYVTGYGVTDGEYVDCQGCYGTGQCWHCGGSGIEPN